MEVLLRKLAHLMLDRLRWWRRLSRGKTSTTIHDWFNSGRPCECVVIVGGTAGVETITAVATHIIITICVTVSGWWRLCQWKWWRRWWRQRRFLIIIIYIVDCWVAVACYRIVVICRSIATVIVNRLWIGYIPIAVCRYWRWSNWWLFLLLRNWRKLKWWHLSIRYWCCWIACDTDDLFCIGFKKSCSLTKVS